MEDFEKLGAFYLGREYDLSTKEMGGLLLYDSKDLVTHGVCVGMTGSGKTGLCIGLLEEAAIDGVPSIVIDPKGDLADLMLTFPELRPEDFRPWVSQEEAAKKSLSIDDFATQQAEMWKKGLADWGQDPGRIQRLKDAADFTIYTPGSNAGLPVSILKSFAAPSPAVRADDEALRDRINTAVTSILGLVGVTADPIQSREHILLSSLFYSVWSAGQDLDLAGLIQQIQKPPFTRVGVLDLDSFYPAKERFELAMLLNNLLAAPTFQTWLEGDALDIGQMLFTSEGRPRVSIFSIAHLSDTERMFFVSLLLNEVLGWVRAQQGTGSLRAIIYMDEIFGFFPPVAEPPSKRPLLTLLKQARAFGVGILLATQNPVDLDYKGLANAGTWFIGRLQTERDKARLLEGLEGVAAGSESKFDRQKMEETLAGLGKRVFLMYNVHEDAPVVFQTRWALSYLPGPLTRAQIKTLMDPRRPVAAPAGCAPASSSPGRARTGDGSRGTPGGRGGRGAGRDERTAGTASRDPAVLLAASRRHPAQPRPGLPGRRHYRCHRQLREHREWGEHLHQDPTHRLGPRERSGARLGCRCGTRIAPRGSRPAALSRSRFCGTASRHDQADLLPLLGIGFQGLGLPHAGSGGVQESRSQDDFQPWGDRRGVPNSAPAGRSGDTRRPQREATPEVCRQDGDPQAAGAARRAGGRPGGRTVQGPQDANGHLVRIHHPGSLLGT